MTVAAPPDTTQNTPDTTLAEPVRPLAAVPDARQASQDERFVALVVEGLRGTDLRVSDPALAAAYGRELCDWLSHPGRTPDQLITAILARYRSTPYQARVTVNAATEVYCPKYASGRL